ncbi:MAG TPA: virulence factor [Anaerolineales bacterium]|nr:virulence factor [Anaerolineales bacterium]
MAEVQVVSWRDIPAQVKARQAGVRASRSLATRFQEAVDAAAMRAGMSETDDYLGEWSTSSWEEKPGTPEEAAESRAAEIEAEYTEAELQRLIENGGRSPTGGGGSGAHSPVQARDG